MTSDHSSWPYQQPNFCRNSYNLKSSDFHSDQICSCASSRFVIWMERGWDGLRLDRVDALTSSKVISHGRYLRQLIKCRCDIADTDLESICVSKRYVKMQCPHTWAVYNWASAHLRLLSTECWVRQWRMRPSQLLLGLFCSCILLSYSQVIHLRLS